MEEYGAGGFHNPPGRCAPPLRSLPLQRSLSESRLCVAGNTAPPCQIKDSPLMQDYNE